MRETFDQMDGQSAWQPYDPAGEHPWNAARAAHLYRRAGFGGSSPELRKAAQQTPAEILTSWLEPSDEAKAFQQQADEVAATITSGGDPKGLAPVWLYRMLGTPQPLLEKMTLFWHGHFATSADKVTDPKLMQHQHDRLRHHALGDFAALVQEISRDPAMLIYLDSDSNRKSHPNENYAREVMELFCLGEGNYSEQDVQQVARCFTGWEIRRGKYRFNRYQHDFETKSILGQEGKFGGEDAVKIILQQPAGYRFIARKLFHFFVCDEPAVPDALIEPLAEQLRKDNWHIAGTVRRILTSRLFYSPFAMGRKIRSPVELSVGLLRSLEASTNTRALADRLSQLGQGLFFPPNVKGWDGGRSWINSSTLLGRANLVRELLENDKTRYDKGSLLALAQREGHDDPEAQVDWLTGLLLAVPLTDSTRRELIKVAAGKQEKERRLRRTVATLATLPEFQLG